MKEWKDMTKLEKFGIIELVVFCMVGMYVVTYKVALWTLAFAEWLDGKMTELEGYVSGRKARKLKSEEV